MYRMRHQQDTKLISIIVSSETSRQHQPTLLVDRWCRRLFIILFFTLLFYLMNKLTSFLKNNWPIISFFWATLVIALLAPSLRVDPALNQIKENQQTLLKLNQQITANSTQWQILEEQQKALSTTNQSLRKQRDELESAIAEAMGLQTGGKATTPSTTMSWSVQTNK